MQRLSGLILILVLFLFMGCQDEDILCPVEETGTLSIAFHPDTLDIAWTLNLPGGLVAVGQSDSTLSEMPVGPYQLSTATVDGWVIATSSSNVQTLTTGSTLVFSTEYAVDDSPSGVVEVHAEPGCLGVNFILTGPSSNTFEGHGSEEYRDLEEGDWTLTWGDVDGYEKPDPSTVTQYLAQGDTIHFNGSYTIIPPVVGMLFIDVLQDDLEATWTLTGPDGFSQTGASDAVVGNLPVGNYTLVFDDIYLWQKPEDFEFSIGEDAPTVIEASYVVGLPEATTPDILMNNFYTVYEEMFAAGYESILSSTMRLVLLQQTIDEWDGSDNPFSEPILPKDQMIEIHEKMFTGMAGVDPSGIAVPPVVLVNVVYLEKEASWEPIEPTDIHFGDIDGAYTSTYYVLIYFNTAGNHRFEVSQSLRVVVVQEADGWKLAGIKQYPGGSPVATETLYYDSVLSMYR